MSDTNRDERIELVRGAAVICMVQFHTIDSFASSDTKASWVGQLSVFFGGGAAPLFLTLAGLGAGLAFGKNGRILPLLQRGLYIWSIGILFRVQEWALGGAGASSLSLIRVDVLNCIGLSLVILAGVLALIRRFTRAGREVYGAVLLGAAAAFIGLAPTLLPLPFILPLPALAYYFGGPGHLSLFPLFPWAGMTCLGAAFASAMHTRAPAYALGTYGLIVAARLVAPDALHFAPLNHNIVFTLERCSLSLGLLALAQLFPFKRTLLLLGAHSLLVYWVHVELVYGLWFHRIKATLSPASALAAAAGVLLAMWILSQARRKLPEWRHSWFHIRPRTAH